jgi:fermentation-respiration switch protein FrsA (DUF1100 family)
VHGENDQLIKPELGRKLFDAARAPKEFVLVKGGSHHNTNAIGAEQYREALARIFELNSTKIQPRRLAKLGLTITP